MPRTSTQVCQRPDSFLPFKLDEQQARDAILFVLRAGLEGLLSWLAAWNGPKPGHTLIFPWRTLRLLGTWQASRRCRISSIEGMYLPFWLFDGIVEVRRAVAKGDFGPPLVQRQEFDNLLYPGVDQPRYSLMERMPPFDWQTLAPYEPRLLADWPIRVHSLDVDSLVAGIQQRMIAQVKRRIMGRLLVANMTATQTSLGLQTLPSPTYRVRDMTYRLVLVPAWIATLDNRERRFLALVNGQTGKVARELLERRAKSG